MQWLSEHLVLLHLLASQVCSQSWPWLLHSKSISHTFTPLPHFCVLQFCPLHFRVQILASQVCSQSWPWLLHSKSISHTFTPLPHFCVLQFCPLHFRVQFLVSHSLPRAKPETKKTRPEPKRKNTKYENNDDDSYEKYKGIAIPSLRKWTILCHCCIKLLSIIFMETTLTAEWLRTSFRSKRVFNTAKLTEVSNIQVNTKRFL